MLELAALFIAFVGNIFLSLFTLFKNPKSSTNRLFFLFALTLSVYLVFNYQINLQVTDEGTLFWVKLVMTTALFIVLFFYLLATTFPKSKLQMTSWTFWYAIIFTLSLVPFSLLNYIFVSTKAFGKGGVPGPAMPFFLIHSITLLGGGFLTLLKKYKKVSGIEKIQLKLFLYSTILMFASILTTNLFFVLIFKTAAFINLLPLYTLIFVGFISYAIVKHRFLDINLLVTRTVSYAILVVVIAGIYSLAIYILGQFFFKLNLTSTEFIILTTLSILTAISFFPLRRRVEKYTDRFLFKDRYDTNEVLGNLSRIMASTLRLEDLSHGMLGELIHQARITRAAFILLEDDSITDFKSEGFKSPPTLDEEDIRSLSKSRHALVFDELEEGVEKQLLRKLEFSVVVHLRTEGEQVGLLAVGEKLSGDIYLEQDLKLFEILAPEAAIAIQNAKAYEEIRRFNITLQEEVDRATSDLKSANEKLQELDKLKDEFVSLASHELRTPMTAIKGSLSTILDGYVGEVSGEAREFLTAAFNENDRLIRLVNNLLNISRIEAGRFTFTTTKVDMDKLNSDVVHNLEMAAKEKGITLTYQKDGPLPPVLADEDKVKEVIINLIGNAIKFTHKGGVTVATVQKDGKIITSVTDTGSGIAKEDQDLLFKKFSQIHGSYAKQTGGTGLGLYISKQIIEGLKGTIWLESTLGKGSTFFFSLPIA